MSPRGTIARRELAGVFRERTILLAVVIQVFVAGFSSFLVVGLSALLDPDSQPVAFRPTIATNGTSPLTDDFARQGFEVVTYASDALAREAFDTGKTDAALSVRRPANESIPLHVTLVLPDGDFRSTFILVKAKAALEASETALRAEHASRLSVDPPTYESPTAAGSYAFVYALLVPLLVLLPVVLAGALTADSITEEIQRGTLPLLLQSPATAADVVEGKLVGNLVLVPILALAWFSLLAANGLPLDPLGSLGILALATALAALLGLLACAIALWTRDRNRAQVIFATAFFVVLEVTLLLPTSPVNAMALLAAGSATPAAWLVVAGSIGLAAVGWVLLRVALRRLAPRLAAGA